MILAPVITKVPHHKPRGKYIGKDGAREYLRQQFSIL